MRVEQVAARFRLRLLRRAVARWPTVFEQRWTLSPPAVPAGWPTSFVSLDSLRFRDEAEAARLLRAEFSFLGQLESVEDDWYPSAPQLWRFHLHYWDWSWHVVNNSDEVRRDDWLELTYHRWHTATSYGVGDAWSPYVVSLRLWTWCGLHAAVAGSTIQETLSDEIRRHAGYLRANIEDDVGGNHLIKNLKGLIGAGVFLQDEGLVDWAAARLTDQLAVQVLADGGHYERSPSYHAQVLGDLIDLQGLLRASGGTVPVEFDEAIHVMRLWLGLLIGPDGDVPVFNDGYGLGADELHRLGVAQQSSVTLTVLAESGYVVVWPRAGVQIVIDVGLPCPDDLPAHAHADCLSFELVVGGDRVIVDTGTSEYGATQRRQLERSTAAHNTVEIDGCDQTEVWGAFRAARRARPRLLAVSERDGVVVVDAEHDGYRRLAGRPTHRRRFEISEHGMVVHDRARGGGFHTVISRLHVAGLVVDVRGNVVRADAGGVVIRSGSVPEVDVTGRYAREFGGNEPSTVLLQRYEGRLPMTLTWEIGW